jgi:sulfur transfer protein SufE
VWGGVHSPPTSISARAKVQKLGNALASLPTGSLSMRVESHECKSHLWLMLNFGAIGQETEVWEEALLNQGLSVVCLHIKAPQCF